MTQRSSKRERGALAAAGVIALGFFTLIRGFTAARANPRRQKVFESTAAKFWDLRMPVTFGFAEMRTGLRKKEPSQL